MRTYAEQFDKWATGSLDNVSPGYRELDYTVRIGGAGTAEQFDAVHQAVMKTSPNFFNLNQPIRMNGRLEIL
jgi:hypothetical protein